MPGEVWFYHLERSSLEEVLPDLLHKTLARNWRALVTASDRKRLASLDARLWTWSDDAFLAHGFDDEPFAARQPILLSAEGRNLNEAQVLFVLDGPVPEDVADFERCVVIFDGSDQPAVEQARSQWRRLADAGATISYWRQTGASGWERQA